MFSPTHMKTRLVIVILVVGSVLSAGTYVVLQPDHEAAMADYAVLTADAGHGAPPR